jgi:hypothetical protein
MENPRLRALVTRPSICVARNCDSQIRLDSVCASNTASKVSSSMRPSKERGTGRRRFLSVTIKD